MGLEVATTIAGLVATNPVGATDFASQGDDHLRMLKVVLQTDAARLSEANAFVGAQTAHSFIPSSATVPANGLYKPATNTVGIATNTTLRWSVNASGNHAFAAPSSGATASFTAFADGGAALSMIQGAATGIAAIGPTDGLQIGTSSSHSLKLVAGNSNRMVLTSSGNVSIAAPASGTSLSIAGVSGGIVAAFNGPSAASSFVAFQTASAAIGYMGDRAGITVSAAGLGIRAETTLALASGGGSERIILGSSGNVTINAPSSGPTLAVESLDGEAGLKITSSSVDTRIYAYPTGSAGVVGTVSNHKLELWTNASAKVTIGTSGGVQVGAPTGGDKGAGTVNAAGSVYVNGDELGYRSLNERTFSAADNTAATDNGRCVRYTSTGHTFTLDTDLATNGVVTIRNRGTGNLTIAASGTLSWCNGSGSIPTGSRTLAIGGVVTAVHMGSGNYDIWGVGLS